MHDGGLNICNERPRLSARARIPVLARAAGTTVLRRRVSAYACADRRCRPIQAEGSIVLEVRAER